MQDRISQPSPTSGLSSSTMSSAPITTTAPVSMITNTSTNTHQAVEPGNPVRRQASQLAISQYIIKPEFSIEAIKEFAEHARDNIRPAVNQNIVLVIGSTGAGKSTSINYLLGCQFKKKSNVAGFSAVPLDADQEFAKIGQGAKSETRYPRIYRHILSSPNLSQDLPASSSSVLGSLENTFTSVFSGNQSGAIAYCDCPGFRDNRSDEDKVFASIGTELVVNLAKKIVGIMVVIEVRAITTERGDSLRNLTDSLSKLLVEPAYLKSSVLFVFTKVESRDKDELMELINDVIVSEKGSLEKLKTLYDSNKVNSEIREKYNTKLKKIQILASIKENKNNVVLLDVFDQGESRADVLTKLSKLTPIPNGYDLIFVPSFYEFDKKRPVNKQFYLAPGENDSIFCSVVNPKGEIKKSHIQQPILQEQLGNEYSRFKSSLSNQDIDTLTFYFDSILKITSKKGHTILNTVLDFEKYDESRMRFNQSIYDIVNAGILLMRDKVNLPSKLSDLKLELSEYEEKIPFYDSQIEKFSADLNSKEREKQIEILTQQKNKQVEPLEELKKEIAQQDGKIAKVQADLAKIDTSDSVFWKRDFVDDERNIFGKLFKVQTKKTLSYRGLPFLRADLKKDERGTLTSSIEDKVNGICIADYISAEGEDGKASMEIYIERRNKPDNKLQIQNLNNVLKEENKNLTDLTGRHNLLATEIKALENSIAFYHSNKQSRQSELQSLKSVRNIILDDIKILKREIESIEKKLPIIEADFEANRAFFDMAAELADLINFESTLVSYFLKLYKDLPKKNIKKTNKKEEDEALNCIITLQPYIDPVSVPCCGATFERQAIIDRCSRGSTCPICSKSFNEDDLKSITVLRAVGSKEKYKNVFSEDVDVYTGASLGLEKLELKQKSLLEKRILLEKELEKINREMEIVDGEIKRRKQNLGATLYSYDILLAEDAENTLQKPDTYRLVKIKMGTLAMSTSATTITTSMTISIDGVDWKLVYKPSSGDAREININEVENLREMLSTIPDDTDLEALSVEVKNSIQTILSHYHNPSSKQQVSLSNI